jgi:hypothetical protein
MSVHLQTVRLFATTENRPNAGSDDGVEFWFHVDPHLLTTYTPAGWNAVTLSHPWDDRERGRTEMYEVSFKAGDVEVAVSGTIVPRGLAFNDFAHARSASFWVRMRGNDWWRIDHYYLVGRFKELEHIPGTIDSFRTIDHGWLLIARREGDVDMSTDPSEGVAWHHIALNVTICGTGGLVILPRPGDQGN